MGWRRPQCCGLWGGVSSTRAWCDAPGVGQQPQYTGGFYGLIPLLSKLGPVSSGSYIFFFHCLQNVNLQRCASSCHKVELFYLDMEVRVASPPLKEQIQVCTWHVGPFPQPQRETHLPSVNAPFPSCLFSEASITCLFWSFFLLSAHICIC